MITIPDEVKTLLIAGFFGSLVRVLIKFPKSWKQWCVQMSVGVICAVFLGRVVGMIIGDWTGDMSSSLSAAGFIIGTAAEQIIAKIQKKVIDEKDAR